MPAAIRGAYEAWPRTRKLPRLGGKIRLRFGQPIPAADVASMKGGELTARCEADVRRLFDELG